MLAKANYFSLMQMLLLEYMVLRAIAPCDQTNQRARGARGIVRSLEFKAIWENLDGL